ncbi:hypothetical protein ACFPZ0_05345 [Streptomonospora nanhaiensis]|uniref:Uncharacterized protein n=1 Tax=Streptomonospora nanhaiensis TaxID=1323731 RepID=A0A853BIF7_9ACTN|nr:hypothetical protein [Streptomonospora nanhaiensis]MBV2365038.1 hypothetical protein [Streptomonospora nanhaiensis]MBX9388293.1 hypothetical protein [Streptomonospora nanhaiensis]NYI94504.1 hypothetical protein [Streptomonospora nanhaiensis]
MDPLQWQTLAVAAAATLLLVADLALRRRENRTGTAVPPARDLDAMAARRRGLEEAGLPLARQEAAAGSRVDQLAEAVEDAAAGRALVALADVARHVRATDRLLAQAGQAVDAVVGAGEAPTADDGSGGGRAPARPPAGERHGEGGRDRW